MKYLDRVDNRLIAASPLPWTYSTVASIGGGSLYDATRMIASLHYEQPGEHDGRIVRFLPEHEADANGDLIAHAPEDLAALVTFARSVKAILGEGNTMPLLALYGIEQTLIRLENHP